MNTPSTGLDYSSELRALEVDRLDALQAAHWHAAINGDVVAARLVLRIIDQRCRLLGLYDAKASHASNQPEGEPVFTFGPGGQLVPAGEY